MSFRSLAAGVCLAILLRFAAHGQTPQAPQTPRATLSISCEDDCAWTVDGDQHGVLKKGEEAHVKVLFGAHRIEATSSDGRHWERTVEIKQPNEEHIWISFASGPSPVESGPRVAVPAEKIVLSDESAGGIPTFYSQGRQVIVEAEVWNHVDKKHAGDASWIPYGSLEGLPDGGAALTEILKRMPPPARGLTAKDFHVFDNGAEQSINYFKEADFAAIGPTRQWVLYPTTYGVWGILQPGGPGIGGLPSATYQIGYVPPPPQPGECHTIQLVSENHYVLLNRKQYCALKNSDAAMMLQKKLEAGMQSFANSTAQGLIKVAANAFTFWSSGVLTLLTAASSNTPPASGFMYVVEVHDSKAPATIQIATEFTLPKPVWDYPCRKNNPAVHVLGILYGTSGKLSGQFADTFKCQMVTTPMTEDLKKIPGVTVTIPSRFNTQIQLRPGDYELRVVVSDGKQFGRARVPLRVEPLDTQSLAISDVALNSILRDASWIARDATSVTPAPLVPSPLVSNSIPAAPVPGVPPASENVQFLPVPDAQLYKNNPLSVYFEIYEPVLDAADTAIYYRMRITNLNTGATIMDTEPISAADFVVPGNEVVPVGLKLNTDKLAPGSYRLEIQASDSAGRQSAWRQSMFAINGGTNGSKSETVGGGCRSK